MIKIYTDGGCRGNPGPGGWAYIIVLYTFQGPKVLAEQYGSEKQTTNNRMELSAVIESLKALKTMNDCPRNISIYTDSQYVQKGISEWIKKWKINSWKTSERKPVKNQDLWKELDTLTNDFSVAWEWVPGHSGVEFNERCDLLAQQAMEKK